MHPCTKFVRHFLLMLLNFAFRHSAHAYLYTRGDRKLFKFSTIEGQDKVLQSQRNVACWLCWMENLFKNVDMNDPSFIKELGL